MKVLGFLIVALALVAGLVGSGSAYLVRVERGPDVLLGLTSNENVLVPVPAAPAPANERGDTSTQVLLERGERIDAGHVEALARANVRHVRVEEFALARWEGKWLFALGVLGLGLGAFIVRYAARAALADAPDAETRTPSAILAEIRAGVERVRTRLQRPGAVDQDGLLSDLGIVVEDQLPAFPAGRDRMVARFGLGGYAALMDRFAAAERQLHRAWSATADGYLEEAAECVERGASLLVESQEELERLEGVR